MCCGYVGSKATVLPTKHCFLWRKLLQNICPSISEDCRCLSYISAQPLTLSPFQGINGFNDKLQVNVFTLYPVMSLTKSISKPSSSIDLLNLNDVTISIISSSSVAFINMEFATLTFVVFALLATLTGRTLRTKSFKSFTISCHWSLCLGVTWIFHPFNLFYWE